MQLDDKLLEYFKLCMEDDTDDDPNNDSCLISGNVLTDHHVVLPCNHKFNYLPLFREVYKQKCTINHRDIIRIPYKSIKCPYCRSVNCGILPHIESFGLDKVEGVNWPEKYSIMTNTCDYTYRSGKNKGDICGKLCINKYCTRHKTLAVKLEPLLIAVKKNIDREKCTQCINTKTGSRACKRYAKDKGLCGIHLKLNSNID